MFGKLVKTQGDMCCNSKAMGIQFAHIIRIKLGHLFFFAFSEYMNCNNLTTELTHFFPKPLKRKDFLLLRLIKKWRQKNVDQRRNRKGKKLSTFLIKNRPKDTINNQTPCLDLLG